MDMKQILIFGLLLVPVWTCRSRCYTENELQGKVLQKLKRTYLQPSGSSSTDVAGSRVMCPVDLYRQQLPTSLHERSLSPWRNVQVTKEDRYPSTYTEAQCLCSGCILIQDRSHGGSEVVESHDYNSVPIKQKKFFLKRKLCKGGQNGGKKYSLRLVSEEVTVGCTCARAQSSS